MYKQTLADGKHDYLINLFHSVESFSNVVTVIKIMSKFKFILLAR